MKQLDDEPVAQVKGQFFFKLERELDKVNAFYLLKEAEYSSQLVALGERGRLGVNESKLKTVRDVVRVLSDFQNDVAHLQV